MVFGLFFEQFGWQLVRFDVVIELLDGLYVQMVYFVVDQGFGYFDWVGLQQIFYDLVFDFGFDCLVQFVFYVFLYFGVEVIEIGFFYVEQSEEFFVQFWQFGFGYVIDGNGEFGSFVGQVQVLVVFGEGQVEYMFFIGFCFYQFFFEVGDYVIGVQYQQGVFGGIVGEGFVVDFVDEVDV